MFRVLSYNISVGGVGRAEELTKMMRSQHPDIVGLIEATNAQIVLELAEKLGLSYHYMSGQPAHEEDWHVAVLSRFPIIGTPVIHDKVHEPLTSLTKPCLEACIKLPDKEQITVFVAHPTADFGGGNAGNKTRKKEIQGLLQIMRQKKGTPHILMGDFSAVSRGEWLKGSNLLSYVAGLQLKYKENPDNFLEPPSMSYIFPSPLDKLSPLLKVVPKFQFLSTCFDLGTNLIRAPRANLGLLQREGYVDCFRNKNRRAEGFTSPTVALAARLDYIFASPELAPRLLSCSVIESASGIKGEDASDHLPVFAEFKDLSLAQTNGNVSGGQEFPQRSD